MFFIGIQVTKEKDTPFFSLVFKPQKHPIEQSKNQSKVMDVGPKEVRDLLEKYERIVAGRKIETLPPERDVSHCIDIIPRATLPNKVAYKMSPEQKKEIARQIEELLAKGFIRKSISPCAVPIVLAPKK